MSQHFSIKAFSLGMALAGAFLLAAGIFLQMNAQNTLQKNEERLSSQTVLVNWKMQTPLPHPDESPLHEEGAASGMAAPEEKTSLPAAPLEGLYKTTELGPMPIIDEKDGNTPFKAYRRPFDSYASDSPVIAIALADSGLSKTQMESALEILPPDISFIASPYAEALDQWTKESRAHGHEIWLLLPVESEGYPENDSGPQALFIDTPETENLAKLDWLMTRTTGYAGFVTGYNPVFMDSVGDMRPVVGAIFTHGLALIDGASTPGIVQQTMASGMKAPYSNIDLWIDWPDSSPESIRKSLDKLESIAREKGLASGIIHPLPGSYQEILAWIKTFPEKNLRLAPLSATTGY